MSIRSLSILLGDDDAHWGKKAHAIGRSPRNDDVLKVRDKAPHSGIGENHSGPLFDARPARVKGS